MGHQESNPNREIHRTRGLSPNQKKKRKKEKAQINNLTSHLKELEKEKQKKPKVSRRKEILKIRAEIEFEKTVEKSMTPRDGSLKDK